MSIIIKLVLGEGAPLSTQIYYIKDRWTMKKDFMEIFNDFSYKSSEEIAKYESIEMKLDEKYKNRIYNMVMNMINAKKNTK